MLAELLNTMRHTKDAQGFDVKLIKLNRGHYRELVSEISRNPMYQHALVEGEVTEINGAVIEVV